MMNRQYRSLLSLCTTLMCATMAYAQLSVPSDGSDGALEVLGGNVTIDLSQALTGSWDMPIPPGSEGLGIYDPGKWAVVFKYSSVTINPGRHVYFANHPSGAPVVWLVQGDVTINGRVYINGQNGTGSLARPSTPGPGGFRGGAGRVVDILGSGGFGPGGADYSSGFFGSGGGHASDGVGPFPGAAYGNEQIMPLIGGSGGSARDSTSNYGGGAGGGAILIAAGGIFTLGDSGSIQAQGGAGASGFEGGSGGAIRIIADQTTGGGILQGVGQHGGAPGRIRVESNINSLTHPGNPPYSFDLPSDPAMIWPPVGAPTITAAVIAGQPVPADPHARFDFPFADVALSTPDLVTLLIEATNVPGTATVKVRVVPRSGESFTEIAAFVSGDQQASTWTADLTLPQGYAAIQIRAELP